MSLCCRVGSGQAVQGVGSNSMLFAVIRDAILAGLFGARHTEYCRLQFTSNIRECVRASVERARYFIRHAKPRKTKRKSQNGLPCVCVAFKRIRLFYAHTHAFTDVRSEAQSTVCMCTVSMRAQHARATTRRCASFVVNTPRKSLTKP